MKIKHPLPTFPIKLKDFHGWGWGHEVYMPLPQVPIVSFLDLEDVSLERT